MLPILPCWIFWRKNLRSCRALFFRRPRSERRKDGSLRLQDFSPRVGTSSPCKAPAMRKEKRAACDLKPGVAEESKTRNHHPCDDLSFAPLVARSPRMRTHRPVLHRILSPSRKRRGRSGVWMALGGEPPLCARRLINSCSLSLNTEPAILVWHARRGARTGYSRLPRSGAGTKKRCAAQIEDALFAFLLKGPPKHRLERVLPKASAISFLSPSTACSFIFRIRARRYPFAWSDGIRLTPTASTAQSPRRSEPWVPSWIVES